jgi:hypothetical protein
LATLHKAAHQFTVTLLYFEAEYAAILEHSLIDQVIEGALRRVVLDQRQGFSSLKVKINTVVNVGGAKA